MKKEKRPEHKSSRKKSHEDAMSSDDTSQVVSEPNPLRPLRDLQYGLGEMVFGGCRHLEYVNIWCFNEPK